MSFSAALRDFAGFFVATLVCLPYFLVAWAVTFALLCYGFRWLKHHVRPILLRVDDHVRYWAVGLRYRRRGDSDTERHALTWFFRFWTNFSSSPALTLWSFMVPIMASWLGAWHRDVARGDLYTTPLFLLPGWSFGGAMLLSFVSKKVFKRLRPERVPGAFGHKMKDGSFPSGHSLTSLVFWAILAVTLAVYGVPIWALLACVGVGSAVVLLTGLSRVYLGVHFPSDVLGGYFIGVVWSVVCFLVFLPLIEGVTPK